MIRLKTLFIALLSLPAAVHALSASHCSGTDTFGAAVSGNTFACGEFSQSGLLPFPLNSGPTSPTINVFIPGTVDQGTASLDSRNLLQFSNGAYFAAQAHSVNGSNFVELHAQSGRLSNSSGVNSHVMAGTSWQDSFRLRGGNGETELAITVAWPGLIPPPPGSSVTNWEAWDTAFLPPTWEANFHLRYKQGTTEVLKQDFSMDPISYEGSINVPLQEYQGSTTYRFTVPYDTWIALEGGLTVSAVNTNKSFASGVKITGIELPTGARLETYSGNPLYTLAAAPVPEPETWAMLLAGLGIVAAAARRKAATGKPNQA